MTPFTTRPELHGTFGMVASTHWLGTAAGMSVLERGGNAFDAVVAAGFVLQVVEPHLNGPGGEVPIIAGLIPRTLILMPTLSIVTSTAGWFLAVRMGFLDLGYPEFWWVIVALAIVTVLTVQGLGYLLPANLRLYFEIQKPQPDGEKIGRWMKTYVRVVAVQGIMQVAIIAVMARFATGF